MSLIPMLCVEFKRKLCHPVDFRVKGHSHSVASWIVLSSWLRERITEGIIHAGLTVESMHLPLVARALAAAAV